MNIKRAISLFGACSLQHVVSGQEEIEEQLFLEQLQHLEDQIQGLTFSQDFGNTGTNWSGNIKYASKEVLIPETEAEITDMIMNAEGQIKAIGSRHSFNDVADVDGTHISLEKFKKVSVNEEDKTITFGAGCTFWDLVEPLKEAKLALAQMPSTPLINVVGAVTTGTHSSGRYIQSFASYVTGFRLIDPYGHEREFEDEDVNFEYYLLSFGALGLITEMTMLVHDEFAIKKCIYENVSWEFLSDDLTGN